MLDMLLIHYLWDVLPVEQFEFAMWIQGWRRIDHVSFKKVYWLGDMVMKFDVPQDKTRDSHTAYEYRVWKNAKPNKRRYLARCIDFHNGLLIQTKLPNVCNVQTCGCADARRIGQRLRILDWFNHGRTASGALRFFDYDNTGSGWWNWKAKTSARN